MPYRASRLGSLAHWLAGSAFVLTTLMSHTSQAGHEVIRLEGMAGAPTDYVEKSALLGVGIRAFGITSNGFGITLIDAYGWTGRSSDYFHFGFRPFVEVPLALDGSLLFQAGLGIGVSGGAGERTLTRDYEAVGLSLSPSLHALYKTPTPFFFGLGVVGFTPSLVPFVGDRGGVHLLGTLALGVRI